MRCSPRSKQARDKLSQRESISRALMHRDVAKLWQAFRLSTRVPEALSSTRIGIEPAISWGRSSAGPRRCVRSSDDTDSRARCDRTAKSPPVVCRSHISAWADIDVCRAVDIHVGRRFTTLVFLFTTFVFLLATLLFLLATFVLVPTTPVALPTLLCGPAMCARPPERAPPRLATRSTSALSGWIAASPPMGSP